MIRERVRCLAFGLAVSVAFASSAQAVECPFPGQAPMFIIRLFFGQDIRGRERIPATAWHSFLQRTVTPRFANGFTVYNAYGQWMNPTTHTIGRERTKVVEIAIEDIAGVPDKIAELTKIYRERFHQQSVGVVTTQGCGAF